MATEYGEIPMSGTPSSTAKVEARRGRVAAVVDEEVVQTSFRLPRSRWRRLHEVALDERTSVQALVVAALEAEFKKRGLPF